jgi:hypothetical protein
MGSFVVFCSDDEGLEKQLKDLAKKENIKKVVLTIDNPAGPAAYKVAKDADVTIVLYNQREVKVNHAYKKGALNDAEVDKIVSELSQILPEGKGKSGTK